MLDREGLILSIPHPNGNPPRPGFPNGRRVFDDVAFPYLGVPYSGFNVS